MQSVFFDYFRSSLVRNRHGANFCEYNAEQQRRGGNLRCQILRRDFWHEREPEFGTTSGGKDSSNFRHLPELHDSGLVNRRVWSRLALEVTVILVTCYPIAWLLPALLYGTNAILIGYYPNSARNVQTFPKILKIQSLQRSQFLPGDL